MDEKYLPPKSTFIDFSAFPIYKKITGLDLFSDDIINQFLLFLDNKIDNYIFKKISSKFENSLSLFDLQFISLIFKEINATEYFKIKKIEINGSNTHLIKALEVYNQLNLKNKGNVLSRTAKGLRIFATQNLIKLNHTNLFFDGSNVFLKFKIEGPSNTSVFKLGISLGASSYFEDNMYKSLMKNFSIGLSPQFTLLTKLQPYKTDVNRYLSINPSIIPQNTYISKINGLNRNYCNSMTLGIDNLYGFEPIKTSKKLIFLIIGDKEYCRFSEDFNSLVEDGLFSRFGIKFFSVNDGFPFSLFSLYEGLDIFLNKLPDLEKPVENFFFSGISNSFITSISADLSEEIIQFITLRGFNVKEIGKTNKKSRIRIFNLDSLILDFSLKDIDSLFYKELVCNLSENNKKSEDLTSLSLNNIIKDKISAFKELIGFRINNSFYYANNISSPYKGIRQLVSTSMHSLYPTISDKSFFIGASTASNQYTQNTFSGCVNTIILSVFKLILKGYPIHQVASAILLLISNKDDSNNDRLLVELAVLFTQISFSIPNLSFETCDLVNENISCIINAYSIGYTNNILIKEKFLPGQKLFLLKIKKDEHDIPDSKYFLKLCSSITIQILSKNITSSIVIEKSLISTLIDLCVTENYGISIAPIDNDALFGNSGNALVSVNDVRELDNLECSYIGVFDNSGLIKTGNSNISVNEIYDKIYLDSENNKLFLQPGKNQENFSIINFHKHIIKPQLLVIGFDKYSLEVFKHISQKHGLFFNSKYINYQTQINSEFLKSIRYDISKANIVIICGENISSDKYKEDYLYSLISQPSILDALNELLLKNEGLILSTAEGTRTLFKLGLLPYGTNEHKIHVLKPNTGVVEKGILYRVRISNNYGPWMQDLNLGDLFNIPAPIDNTNLTFNANEIQFWQKHCFANYIDFNGDFSLNNLCNPNGSSIGAAAVTSAKGNIVGFFAPVEKTYHLQEENYNILDKLFSSAVKYFIN